MIRRALLSAFVDNRLRGLSRATLPLCVGAREQERHEVQRLDHLVLPPELSPHGSEDLIGAQVWISGTIFLRFFQIYDRKCGGKSELFELPNLLILVWDFGWLESQSCHPGQPVATPCLNTT